MESILNRSNVREVLLEGGICLALLATLPILAVLGFALRIAVVLAFVAGALLCALLYPFSRSFREWFKVQAEVDIRHRGLRLARDVLLYPAHSWARWGKKTVTVGADDLLLSTVGPVEAVDLPAPGAHAAQGKPLFRIHRGNRTVDVLSPISGSVCESNEVLKVYPELMNDSPFSLGWAVRLSPDDGNIERRSLLQTEQARAWFESEVDRAIESTSSGGEATNVDRYRCIDNEAWDQLSPMFKQQSESDADWPVAI